jgi:hypothetical protein
VNDAPADPDNVDSRSSTGAAPAEPFTTRTISFSVLGSYDQFKAFLKDMERSLQLMDVQTLTFSTSATDLTEYKLEIQLYGLSPVTEDN